ncbi:MAG: hypothetical protein ACLU3F_00600 [Blautia wexlerae]
MNDETWRYAHRCWGWINFVLGNHPGDTIDFYFDFNER